MTSTLFSLNADHGFPNFCWRHIISPLGQSSPCSVSVSHSCVHFPHPYTDLTEAGPNSWEIGNTMSQRIISIGALSISVLTTGPPTHLNHVYESNADVRPSLLLYDEKEVQRWKDAG